MWFRFYLNSFDSRCSRHSTDCRFGRVLMPHAIIRLRPSAGGALAHKRPNSLCKIRTAQEQKADAHNEREKSTTGALAAPDPLTGRTQCNVYTDPSENCTRCNCQHIFDV